MTDPLPRISHEMLVANAGSGKTFRLTIRTINLLASGVSPEKIAALTFTRKAAGEFLEAVFLRLATATLDPGALAGLQRDTGLTKLDAAHCRGMLTKLVANLHRLCMGTIDSLFGRIARAFPMESGLSENFSVLTATGGDESRLRVLTDLFRENGANETRFAAFLEVVRQQSRMGSERQVFRTLLETVGQLHGKFVQTPKNSPWGNQSAIWPNGCAILEAGDPAVAADQLWAAIKSTHPDLDVKATGSWQFNLELVRTHTAGQNWNDLLSKFIKEKLCDCKVDADSGESYLATGGARKARVYLNPTVSSARQQLLYSLLRPKYEELLRRSRSLHAMMAAFENIYARLVRHAGMVTFDDITDAIAQHVDQPTWRSEVGYRLDSRFDHWMLDEFQDTSRPQWKVLGALVDEVVQDEGGERSFFYVGDTKQAIYSWRGGDSKLFFEIRDFYNRGADTPIFASPALNISFRSDPEIIEVVNKVFGDLTKVASTLKLPDQTVSDWSKAWVSHEVTKLFPKNSGYVRWTAVDEKEEEVSLSTIDCEVLKILQEVRPWLRGWSCAALKRNNKDVEALAALLQFHGIPVTVEGKSNPCTDNPLGAALLAAFRFAASPDDHLSGALLAASPLGAAIACDVDSDFRTRALHLISETGFAGAVQAWIYRLDLSGEPFLNTRAAEFLAAAESFDRERQPSSGIGEFVRFVESYQRQDPEGMGVIRIMTVHQAKGLTLDMTVVSGMDHDPFAKDRTAGVLALGTNHQNESWGLLLPPADFCKEDEILSATRMSMLAESAYGELCAAYVAMTRPRHGLYVVTKRLSDRTHCKNLARLLGLTLEQKDPCWELGDSLWYQTKPSAVSQLSFDFTPARTLPKPFQIKARSVSPSQLHWQTNRSEENRAIVGPLSAQSAANVGTEIHRVLAGIEWLDKSPTIFSQSISETAQVMLRSFFSSDPWREVFSRPEGNVLLWRERVFDVLIENRWVNGVFDRVHIFTDGAGRPTSAVVYDFKTDLALSETLAERYHEQMTLYQKAAAVLLGLELTSVKIRIVSVR